MWQVIKGSETVMTESHFSRRGITRTAITSSRDPEPKKIFDDTAQRACAKFESQMRIDRAL